MFFWSNYFGFRYEILVNLPVSHIFYPKTFHYNQTVCQTMSEICLNYLSNKLATTQFDRYLNGLHGNLYELFIRVREKNKNQENIFDLNGNIV